MASQNVALFPLLSISALLEDGSSLEWPKWARPKNVALLPLLPNLPFLEDGSSIEWPKWASPLGQPERGAVAAAFYFITPRGRVLTGMAKMGQPPWSARMWR